MTSTQLQFARIQRYLEKIKRQGASDEAYDDLIGFFQNCWALKDYVKNDSATPASVRNTIEADVKKYESLMITADMANRSKHLKLISSRTGADITHKHIHVFGGSSIQSATARYTLTINDGSTRDALDLAMQAVADWQTLLTTYGLI